MGNVSRVWEKIICYGFGRPSRVEDNCKTGLKEIGICGKN